jgi:hypothetical protein
MKRENLDRGLELLRQINQFSRLELPKDAQKFAEVTVFIDFINIDEYNANLKKAINGLQKEFDDL